MFLKIFNWMIANAPGVLRPVIRWLADVFRDITNYISQRWAALGMGATFWWSKVIFWWHKANEFALTFINFIQWAIVIYIPGFVARKVGDAITVLKTLVAYTKGVLEAAIATLRQWARGAIDGLTALLTQVKDWARHWLDLLTTTVNNLIRLLAHVLHGPDVLAEWLIAATWRATLRLLRAQQDRIALWLTRESVSFTRWLATELENIIMRWL